jgi:hypothetical protein
LPLPKETAKRRVQIQDLRNRIVKAEKIEFIEQMQSR